MKKHLLSKIFGFALLALLMVFAVACGSTDDPGKDNVEVKLTFDKTTVEVEVGEEFEIKSTITGVDATTAVEFSFSKDGVVKYENGKFTALTAGEVAITGKVKGYDKATATANVTVKEKEVEEVNASIVLTVDKAEGYVGDKINVTAKVEGEVDDMTLEFAVSSANATYAAGQLTLVAPGKVTLTASLKAYPNVKASVEVTINEKDPTVTLEASAKVIAVGGKATIVAKLDPTTLEVEWTSDNTAVATVVDGVVTGVSNGKANITATIKGTEISASVEITVAELVSSITATYKPEMNIFDEQTIVVTVLPESAGDKTYTVTSSNDDVMIAGGDVLTAIEGGTVTITITANDGSGVKYEFTVKVLTPRVEATVASPAVESLPDGAEFEYKGVAYIVGKTAFSTIEQAIEHSDNIVYVAAGTYEANVNLNKDGIQLLGPNAGINPNTITRLDEAVMKGVITIAEGVKNVKVSGFAFTGTAGIDCQNGVDNVEVSYNNVYDTNASSTEWVETRVELEAIFDFWFTAGNEGKNIVVSYNKFENINEPAIFVARAKNVKISNNTVHNFTRDAIRGDGGYNYGLWEFTDNTIYNDTMGGYAGIYLQSVSGKDSDGCQEIYVANNTFKNIGVESSSGYIVAFGFRTYQEQGLKCNVMYNTFENCKNCIAMRNNGGSASDYEGNVNYNKFIGVPSGVYHRNLGIGTSDTTSSNPILTNMDYNLFLDAEGKAIVDLAPYASKFVDLKSYNDNFPSKEAYEEKVKELTGLNYSIVVNDDWKDLSEGVAVEAEGFTWTIGSNAFATINAALGHVESGAKIKVLAGNYDETINIGLNNITLLGPNAGVNAQYVNRDAEATISAAINVLSGVVNFTLDGFELIAAGSLQPQKDVDGVAMKYCVITGTATDGIIRGDTSENGFVKNVKFIGNYSVGYKAYRVLHLQYCDGLEAVNNYIVTNGAPFDFLNSSYLRGEVIIKDNTFTGGTNQSFIWCGGVGEINVLIQGNHIEGIQSTIVDFRTMKETNVGATFNVLNNTFKNNACDWRVMRIRTAGYAEGNTIVVNANFNKFIDSYTVVDGQISFCNNPSFGAVADPFNVIYNMDNNYYEVDGEPIIPDSNAYFADAALSWANTYAKESDMPEYSANTEVKPTSLEITNKITKIDAYENYQLTFKIGPEDATNKKLAFKSSNSSAATITSAGLLQAKSGGKATITAYCVADNKVVDTFEIEVSPKSRIEIRCEGNGVLLVGKDTATLEATYYGADTTGLKYTSSDATVATVSETGVVTPLKAGQVTITVSQADKEAKISFTVIETELTGILKVLADGNHATIWNQNIYYIGSDDGSADYLHNVYGSANDYYTGTLPAITKNMLAAGVKSSGTMKSVEFIVVHDTAGSPSTSTAKANSNWCTSASNDGSSWQYTIGNDGIYQQMNDTDIAWHAGDGAAWAQSTTLHDTGVAYEGDRPNVTIGNDAYFYINGKKSNVKAPSETCKTMNVLGMICVKGENGNYFIPDTWVCNQYGERVCARGGNLNGIGIETAVNMGSDVYLTWQMTAKFAAQKLVQYNLLPDRVVFHNNFTNKKCPNTMITSDRVSTFLKLVYAEYEIAKNYSDYTIKFESSNTSILDNTGRVVSAPEYTTNVSYTVTVTKGSETQSITLNTLVIGQYNL